MKSELPPKRGRFDVSAHTLPHTMLNVSPSNLKIYYAPSQHQAHSVHSKRKVIASLSQCASCCCVSKIYVHSSFTLGEYSQPSEALAVVRSFDRRWKDRLGAQQGGRICPSNTIDAFHRGDRCDHASQRTVVFKRFRLNSTAHRKKRQRQSKPHLKISDRVVMYWYPFRRTMSQCPIKECTIIFHVFNGPKNSPQPLCLVQKRPTSWRKYAKNVSPLQKEYSPASSSSSSSHSPSQASVAEVL